MGWDNSIGHLFMTGAVAEWPVLTVPDGARAARKAMADKRHYLCLSR